jgi:hypothetical protein
MTMVFSITNITLVNNYGVNDDDEQIDLTSDNLEEIEYLYVEYLIQSDDSIDSWYLNFTMGGIDACALGNKQDTQCYSYNDSTYKWIQFINASETTTFDATQTIQGDIIQPTISQINSTSWNLSFSIDEHYQNVLKHFSALYNYSDIKWQTGINKRITQNNYMNIKLVDNHSANPFTQVPDAFKVDIRVNYTIGSLLPSQPLDMYTCVNYTTGNPDLLDNCLILCSKSTAQFQDDGTKFRCTGQGNYLSSLGAIPDSIILKTDENNPAKYYAIKSIFSENLTHPSVIRYSTNAGDTYTLNTDGYETEANVNWFNDGIIDPNELILNLYVESLISSKNLTSQIQWNITPNTKYAPVISIGTPEDMASYTIGNNILATWSVNDVNDDELNITLSLNDETIVTNLNQSNTSYQLSQLPTGIYELELYAEKIINTTFNDITMHTFIVASSGTGGIGESIRKIENITNESITKVSKDMSSDSLKGITLLISIILLLLLVIGKYAYRDKRFTTRIRRYWKVTVVILIVMLVYILVAYAV